MIENDDQLQQAHAAVGDMYQLLASYRAKILPVNPRNYALVAQGPLEEIRKIQGEIDAYLGLQEPVAVTQESLASEHVDALREAPSSFGQKKKGQ
jgi:hypothetical protein